MYTENSLENFNIIACSGAIMRVLSGSDKRRISVRFILLFKNGGMKALLKVNEKENSVVIKTHFL